MPVWQAAVGESGVRVRSGTIYSTSDAAARAAMAGKDVAIVARDIYKYEFHRGELVTPFDFVLDKASAIVLLCSKARVNEAPISVFTD